MEKDGLKQYFYFTKKEKAGIFAWLILVIVLKLVPVVYAWVKKEEPVKISRFAAQLALLEPIPDSTSETIHGSQNNAVYNTDQGSTTKSQELFAFDPNNTSRENWQRLGLRNKTIQTIHNYLSKGGRFRSPADLKKIWGMPAALAEDLMPYARISTGAGKKQYQTYTTFPPYEKKLPVPVELNLADSLALVALPGIGPSLARRILKFRDKLGGFYSIDQVGETFGLPDSTFQKIRPLLKLEEGIIKKIPINAASLEELKGHPYIRFQLANVIVQYRQQHGPFARVEDIKKIMIMTETVFDKLAPYLVVD